MRTLPFYRKIIFKVIIFLILVLSLALFTSLTITDKQLDKRMHQNLVKDFNAAQHTTNNFINLIGQTSQIWAKEVVASHLIFDDIYNKDIKKLTNILKNEKNKISADSIILLDESAKVLSQVETIHKVGDSLKHYDIVKQTFKTKAPTTKIARERESFIIYSSALIEQNNKTAGMILIGYFINDEFLENVKKNTNLEIAFIGNSAVMSATKWGIDKNLDMLPVNYLHYQTLLKNQKDIKEINYKGRSYIVAAKRLNNIESLITGSMLFGYPYDWIKEQKNLLFKEKIIIFGIVFFISLIIILVVVFKYSKVLNKLSQSAVKISNQKSYDKIVIDTKDEFELLSNSFNDMAKQLNTLHNNLENQIEHKTKELSELNQDLKNRVKEEVNKNQKKEKVLQQQSKLAQMGEMISMIAHQWRQPLGAISTSTIGIQLKIKLKKYDFETKEGRDDFFEFLDTKLSNILEYVKFLSTTIDDFRSFFKPDKDKEVISIKVPVNRALGIVETSISNKGIDISTDFKSDDKLSLYQNEMMQVVLNILKNCEDNFIEKNIENPQIKICTQKQNDIYIISICDNGGGIAKEILPNTFDPYFSTKDEKNGTGLGLYMSKIMVEEHNGGKLEVENIDDGVCFKMILTNEEISS